MDKLSINLLTANDTNINNTNTNELSLFSLANNKKDINYIDNINNLIKSRKHRRKQLLHEYNKLFDRCIERINIANKMNKTDICFDIPEYILGCNDYIVSECLDFIQNKLRSLYIDTLKITNNSLFISWMYIELNREIKTT
jgi:hypothetical protein